MRNQLLNYPTTDMDCCSAASTETAIRLFLACGAQVVEKQKELGTLEVRFPRGTLEYTPFRRESYGQGGAHRPQQVIFTNDLGEDALRRDFTVNALYYDCTSSQLIDPLGGLDDLRARRLRTCSSDPFLTLRDDGLRLLRMARFAGQLGFSPTQALLEAAKAYADNILAIPSSRVAAELQKICLADTAYGQQGGHVRALRLLDTVGVLALLIPPLEACRGVAQRPKYHAYDVLEHCICTYAACPPTLCLRLAGLLHDIAKPVMLQKQGKTAGHDGEGAAMVPAILAKLGFSNAVGSQTAALVRWHMCDLQGDMQESRLRVLFATLGFPLVEQLIELRRADLIGTGRPSSFETVTKWVDLLAAMRAQGAIDDMRLLAIDGADIMQATGLPAGKHIGAIKRELFCMVAREPEKNQKKVLTKAAAAIAKEIGII